MSTLEQALIEKITRLDPAEQLKVMAFLQDMEAPRSYSARELLQLPPDERDRLVALAFASAAEEDFELFLADGDGDA